MSQKGTVLVVDDNRLVLATLTAGLTRAGYHVIDADNGDDAILLAREHRPDLALLDIRMEGKSGFDVAGYLRSQCQVPFMFLSAFADDETVAKVRALGAVDYLVKPLDIGKIVPAVDAAFTQINGRKAAASSAAVSSARASGAGPAELLDTAVAMAAGVLMHRYSVNRQVALERLRAMAAAEARALAEQAERILCAVEDLALPAGTDARR